MSKYYGAVFESDSDLKHYGVLGMKWGVRRNRAKAYAKAVKKDKKLQAKVDKYTERMARHTEKFLRRKEAKEQAFWKHWAANVSADYRNSREYAKFKKDDKKRLRKERIEDMFDGLGNNSAKDFRKLNKYIKKSAKWKNAMKEVFGADANVETK